MATAAATVERPPRGLDLVKQQSTPEAVAVLGIGALSIFLAIVGPLVVLWMNGFTPLEDLVSGFKSGAFRGVLWTAVALGLIAIAGAGLIFKRQGTKISREETIAAAVLGAQAIVLAILLIGFAGGDVQKFAENYLDFSIIGEQDPGLKDFFNGAKNTVVLAFSGEFFGMLLGLVLAVFAISKRAVLRAPARVYINLFRGTPLVLQIIFIGVGLPIGLGINIPSYRAMIIALSLNAAAYLAEVFRAGIQSIERGQLEAARGLGMSYLQAMRYAILPQAVRRVIPPLLNEFVILIKDTALVLVLGLTAGERELMTYGDFGVANTFNASFYILIAAGYLAVALPLIRVVNVVERKMRSGLVGVGA
jgi:polar amino acid transport system permease protein